MRRVLITNPRSGTHYLKTLLAFLLGEPPLEHSFAGSDELAEALRAASPTQLVYGHFYFSKFAAALNPAVVPGLRLVVLTRHPFDRLISQLAREKALGGRLPDPTRSPQQLAREQLLGAWDGVPWADGYVVDDFAAVHNFYLRELVSDWLEQREAHLVRFEELIADPVAILAGCLNFLRVTPSPGAISAALRAVSFESLSAGRQPGQVDPASHYRAGISGEWRSVFMPTDLDSLRKKYATAFQAAGYTL